MDKGLVWPEPRGVETLPQVAEERALEAALEHLAVAARWRPNHEHAHRLAGRVYVARKEWMHAAEAFKQARERAPDNPLLGWEAGLVYDRMVGLIESEAGTSLAVAQPESKRREAWEESGFSAGQFMARGERAREQGHYEEAYRWYERAVVLGGEVSSIVWYTRFLELQAQGEEQATHALQRAVADDAGWGDQRVRLQAWLIWGRWLYEQQRFSEAEAAFALAAALFEPGDSGAPSDRVSSAYWHLGQSLLQQERLADALQSFEKAIEWNGQNGWAYITYGQTLYRLDPARWREAEQAFERALHLQPDNADQWTSVIHFWTWVGESERAKEVCQQARSTSVWNRTTDACGALGVS
ncbi:MAG: tetratricopeptide repeat protein [Chloroflexota bacterium]|nr:tetratricopeptide repeat protein [Chloroflexota bacterium]